MRIKSGHRGSSGTKHPNGQALRYHSPRQFPLRRGAKIPPVDSAGRFGRMIDELASDRPAPASGSAAAAVVAAASALLEKVARLSSRRWDGAAGARERAHGLRLRAEELIETDKDAYLGYVAALRSGEAIELMRTRTIDTPLEIARVAAAAVELADELASHGNPNLRPDAVVAAILAHAALQSAAMLVHVNVGSAADPRLREADDRVQAASRAVGRLTAPARSE